MSGVDTLEHATPIPPPPEEWRARLDRVEAWQRVHDQACLAAHRGIQRKLLYQDWLKFLYFAVTLAFIYANNPHPRELLEAVQGMFQ